MIFSLTFIPGASARAAGPIDISMISKGVPHQFWRGVMQGAMRASLDYNVVVTFEGPENESMVDEQIDLLSSALEKNPSALCIDALDSKAVIPLVQKAQKAKIPVIGFDSGVEGFIPVTTAATGSSTR